MRVQLAQRVQEAISNGSALSEGQISLLLEDLTVTADRLDRGIGCFTAEAIRLATYVNSCN
jgi:hypothetical protein